MKRHLRKALLLGFAMALGVMPSVASASVYGWWNFGGHGGYCYETDDTGYGPGIVCYLWY